MAPTAVISVLVWANEALVLWLLMRLLAQVAITIPAAMATYLLWGTAGMASSLPGGIGVNEPATMLRRLITLWSMVALAAAIGVIPLPPGLQLKRDSWPWLQQFR